MNNFLLIVAGILVLVLAALFAVPPMINWNDYRGAFEEEASRLLDREVRVRGDVSVRLLPVPYVSFEKVRIADAPGVPGSFARAEQFKMWLAVPPLLRGAVEARQIELDRPIFRLRSEPDGSGNWRKLQINPNSLAYIPKDVALNSVRIKQGTLLFESHHGHEISKLSDVTGELTAVALAGPFKFIGTVVQGQDTQEVRFSTARMADNGDVQFRAALRRADNSVAHTINGKLVDLLGSARAEGRLVSRATPSRGEDKGLKKQAGYELTADVKLDAKALSLDNIAIAFQNKDRQQSLNGSAKTTWREGVVTETRLAARWLDLDAIAGTKADEGPLEAVERLLVRGIEPLGSGVTSLGVTIDQANLAGTSISDLTGRLVRRDGVTKIEAFRASLPGRSALALNGFIERRKTGLQFDGSLLLRSASLSELAQWIRVGLDKDTEQALATPFSLKGKVRLRPNSFDLSDARVHLAGSMAEGNLNYDWSGRPALIANIDTDTFALGKFGRDLLAPARLSQYLGIVGTAREQPARWYDATDITLRLRANKLTDGNNTLTDVDLDLGRSKETLSLSKFDMTWDPGLSLALSGNLQHSTGQPSGKLRGTLGVAGGDAQDRSAEQLAHLLGLVVDREISPEFIAARIPLRLGLTADVGVGQAVESTGGRAVNRIVADGLIGRDRIRIEAQTFGRLDELMTKPVLVEARIDGKDALTTTRWLVGQPLGSQQVTSQPNADAEKTPATLIMTAAGVPEQSMKTFVRVAGGKLLDADFDGKLSFAGSQKAGGQKLVGTWSGQIELRQANAKNLARLSWPALEGYVNDMPVSGRVLVASTKTGYQLTPRRLRLGQARLSGALQLTLKDSTAARLPTSRLTGDVRISEAYAPALMGLLMRADSGSTGSPQQWPDTPFDFSHLAALKTDLKVAIGKLNLKNGLLRKATFDVKSNGKTVAVNNLKARLREGTVAGGAKLTKTQAGAKVVAQITAKSLKLGDWAPEVAQAKRLSGKADLDIKLEGRALSPRSLASVIEGKGEIRLSNVRLPGITTAKLTAAAREVIDGEMEIDALPARLAEATRTGKISLGSPTLRVRIANGTVAFPSIVFDLAAGGLRNATFIDLPQWKIDSQWTVTPAPQPRPDRPEEKVNLPAVSVVYNGELTSLAKIEPKINIGDLERELIVRKMEANVARLERLRREDEARAEAERERQRQIEEERRRSLEEERRRRQQSPARRQSANQARGQPQPPPPSPAQPPTVRQ